MRRQIKNMFSSHFFRLQQKANYAMPFQNKARDKGPCWENCVSLYNLSAYKIMQHLVNNGVCVLWSSMLALLPIEQMGDLMFLFNLLCCVRTAINCGCPFEVDMWMYVKNSWKHCFITLRAKNKPTLRQTILSGGWKRGSGSFYSCIPGEFYAAILNHKMNH